ncbi:hypothetical protein LPJ66_011267 [Kickxella alabastrina]|uniref:Uncharacterized protein n=1 Tax=Kickxella alabastrina TaxID=61397 RepID=A0ACC1HYT6_9FUNG|nr:hypothetical protein LPJ66_011267 [Kickxella alabastrina]
MRVIAGSDRLGDAPEEAFDIKGRARRLAEKWRRTIIKRRDGSTEPNAPESPSGGKALDPDHQDLEHDPSSANASAKTESEPVAGAGDKQLAIPAAETAPIGATGDKGTNGMMDAAGDAASAAGNPEQQQPLAAGSE